MNREAERHCGKAETYLGKGEDFYRKAATEIVAAQKADPTASDGEIGKRLGKSADWVGDLVRWITTSEDTRRSSPWAHDTPRRQQAMARQVLRDAPLETVEQIVSELPFERQEAIAAATGDRYAKRRQEYADKEKHESPVQKKEREAAVETVKQKTAEVMAPLDELAIANDLEHATELLTELIASGVITETGMARITKALAGFLDEHRVATAMVGQEAVA